MTIKHWLVMGALLIVMTVLAIEFHLLYGAHDNDADEQEFFVDELTLERERHTAGELPPLRGKGGELTVVYARYFDVNGIPALAWLQRYNEASKQLLTEAKASGTLTAMTAMSSAQGVEVRRPAAGSPWVLASSEEGRRICTPPKLHDGNYASMLRPGQNVTPVDFFVDENTLAFERHTTAEIPPLLGKNGEPTVVVARCFTVDGKRVVAWLQRYNEKSQQMLNDAKSLGLLSVDTAIAANGGIEVRRPEAGSPWVLADSNEGKLICKTPLLPDGNFAPMAQP